MYAGPPTLAPNELLPTPEALPAEGVVEPEVIIGELIIPSLMLRQTIYRGVSMPTLDKGVGYWPGTALPGHVGNVVIAGHRVSRFVTLTFSNQATRSESRRPREHSSTPSGKQRSLSRPIPGSLNKTLLLR